MTWPSVTVNQTNTFSGTTAEIERVLLFIGTGTTNTGTLQAVNTGSDFDGVFGAADSVLKSNVQAAMTNAGQNWFAYVYILPATANSDNAWVDAVLEAQATASVEGVVVLMDITEPAAINRAHELRSTLIATHHRWSWLLLAVGGLEEDETWSDYQTRLAALQDGIAAPAVHLVPRLWGNEPGVLAGRLCNRAVTVADSPARVATGTLTMLGSDSLPVDADGETLDLAVLQALSTQRYSVPMWYPDFDGMYWADGVTLDAEGGDFQKIEHLRVIDKACRAIRLRAIPKIADRSMNSTPASIAAHQTYFGKTLREMAKSRQINGVTFPGEIKTPEDGDIAITWTHSEAVTIDITARPYESPKSITVNVALDLSLEATA